MLDPAGRPPSGEGGYVPVLGTTLILPFIRGLSVIRG